MATTQHTALESHECWLYQGMQTSYLDTPEERSIIKVYSQESSLTCIRDSHTTIGIPSFLNHFVHFIFWKVHLVQILHCRFLENAVMVYEEGSMKNVLWWKAQRHFCRFELSLQQNNRTKNTWSEVDEWLAKA